MQIEGNRQICLIPLIDSSINYKYLHKNRLPNKVSNFYHYVGKNVCLSVLQGMIKIY